MYRRVSGLYCENKGKKGQKRLHFCVPFLDGYDVASGANGKEKEGEGARVVYRAIRGQWRRLNTRRTFLGFL